MVPQIFPNLSHDPVALNQHSTEYHLHSPAPKVEAIGGDPTMPRNPVVSA